MRGAGRTDAGVHATGQVAHVDLAKDWPDDTVRDAVNAHLQMAGETRQRARGGDRRRTISTRASRRPAATISTASSTAARRWRSKRSKAWWVPKPLDADAMHEAAQVLVGRHDFTTFRSAQCQAKSPVRTLDRLDVDADGEVIEIRASARSFLHNQVRSMVGSLKRVGEGGWTAADLAAALDARDRAACGQVAPPDGLYLVKVDYPRDRLSPIAQRQMPERRICSP